MKIFVSGECSWDQLCVTMAELPWKISRVYAESGSMAAAWANDNHCQFSAAGAAEAMDLAHVAVIFIEDWNDPMLSVALDAGLAVKWVQKWPEADARANTGAYLH